MVLPPDQTIPLVCISEARAEQLETLALVLEAVGLDCWPDPATGCLWVTEADAATAQLQLEQYRLENRQWPPLPPPRLPVMAFTPTFWPMVALVLFFLHTGPWAGHSRWFLAGVLDSQIVVDQHQWWRLITALTLHANLGHLMGNCLIGACIVHLLSRLVGYGQAWSLLIGTSALANFCTIALRRTPHMSVGFSTAVFAAIGLLTGIQLATTKTRSWRAQVLPLGAGAALLAVLGTEGEHTDLGAHMSGFLIGLLAGWTCAWSRVIDRLRRPAWQLPLFILAQGTVLLAWLRALQ